MATVDKLPMLAEGYAKLQTDVRHLKMVERPAIIDAIEEARGHGDLSENAEYHAAKERQGQIEASIADIEDKLSRAGTRPISSAALSWAPISPTSSQGAAVTSAMTIVAVRVGRIGRALR